MYEIFTKNIFNINIYKPLLIYLSWWFLHYLSYQLYGKLCLNWSLWDILFSPLIVTSPICKGLNWFIYESSNNIGSIIIMIGSTLSVFISNINLKTD